MNLTLPTLDFRNALAAVASAAERGRISIPALSTILLRWETDDALVTATNLSVAATRRLPLADPAQAPGALCLPAVEILAIAKVAGGQTLALAIPENCATVRITSGRSTWSVETLPADLFPRIGADWGEHGGLHTEHLPGEIQSALRSVAHAATTDENKSNLNGVHLAWGENVATLTLTATDSHRCATTTLPMGSGGPLREAILPLSAVKLIAALPGAVTIAQDAHATFLQFTSGDGALIARLIDGQFPDIRRVIPTGPPLASAQVPASALAAGIQSALAVGGEDGIQLTTREGQIVAAAYNRNTGATAETSIEAEGAGKITAAYSTKYLLQALATHGDDPVTLSWYGSDRPLRIEPATLPARIAERVNVIMPRRF